MSAENVLDLLDCDDSDVDGYQEDSDDDDDYVPPGNIIQVLTATCLFCQYIPYNNNNIHSKYIDVFAAMLLTLLREQITPNKI